jgi:hypothetical protein
MELTEAPIALGQVLEALPAGVLSADSIESAHRAQMASALEAMRPTLEIARSGDLHRMDTSIDAEYANAASSLFSQIHLTSPGAVRDCMDILANSVEASVRDLKNRRFEPFEAAKLLELVKAAIELLRKGPA